MLLGDIALNRLGAEQLPRRPKQVRPFADKTGHDLDILPSSLNLLNGFQQAVESIVTSSVSMLVEVRIPQMY